MSVGSDDSEYSDVTSYCCINCDTRHELGSDAPPLVCDTKYFSDEESIDNCDNIIPLPTARLARYQVFVVIDHFTQVLCSPIIYHFQKKSLLDKHKIFIRHKNAIVSLSLVLILKQNVKTQTV
jgi:hypothetical protein